MAAPSVYPGDYDDLSNPGSGDQLDDVDNPHAATHGAANNAMEATQRTIGLDPQGRYANLSARLDAIADTTADVAPAVDVAFDLIDAKGDIIVGTADNTPVRLPVGGIGKGVIADSGETTGMRYEDVITALTALPAGGVTAAILVKASDEDFDVEWYDYVGIAPGSSSFIATAPYPTGGTIVTYTDAEGDWQAHIFSTPGVDQDFVVTNGVIGKLLAIGGGGGGGDSFGSDTGGGGGAGGVYNDIYAFGVGTHRARVGGGGARNADGGTTKFDDVWLDGGGHGGLPPSLGIDGYDGGSGGGGGGGGGVKGVATRGSLDAGVTPDATLCQGVDGEDAVGAAGGDGGGLTLVSAITGSSVTYAKPGLGGTTGAGADGDTPGSGGQGGGTGSGLGGDGYAGIIVCAYRVA